ncbi:MAG TPA: FG-GAP-like repeat-containing protein [Terriglobia bacterium]|nr:FG-GAP-like repeat-containing protein [Terriglobia bacterium]
MRNKKERLSLGIILAVMASMGSLGRSLQAQTNAVPFVNQPLVPEAAVPGGAGFTLTVNGTGFVAGSIVNWKGSPRATTFVSNSQLTAAILASDISVPGTASVTVTSPAPGGGTSNGAYFQVTSPVSPVLLNSTDYATGQSPYSVAVADFNGDGKPDLVVSDVTPSTVSVFLGNGDGTFQPHVDYPVASLPDQLIVADFNGDGKPDLAVTNGDCATIPCELAAVSILLGNGDGTFQAHKEYATAYSEYAIAAGDFNGDGKLDLAVTTTCGSDSTCANLTGAVSILLGNGDGTFGAHTDYPSPALEVPGAVVVGDFNRDGKLDMAVGMFCPTCFPPENGSVSVFLGNGDGTFQPAVSYGLNSGGGLTMVAADFNGDGILDLVVGDSYVSLLQGNGDGTFRAPVDYPALGPPSALAVGDFNGDGKLDVAAAASNFGITGVSLLYGNGNGTFQTHVDFPASEFASSLAAGDFNADGNLDLVTANENDNTLSVLSQAVGPVVALSPASLTFPTQIEGTMSALKNSTLTNTGNTSLSISSLSASSSFGQKNTCGGSVAVGASCTISVSFDPKTKGTLTGNVSIADNAPGSPQTISLTGTGTAVKLSPTFLEFGSVKVGTTSAPQTITLTNVAPNSALSIGRIALTGQNPGQFAQTNTCGSSVPPGGSCTFSVTFTPTKKGSKLADLYIYDNGGASPQIVNLSGVGT